MTEFGVFVTAKAIPVDEPFVFELLCTDSGYVETPRTTLFDAIGSWSPAIESCAAGFVLLIPTNEFVVLMNRLDVPTAVFAALKYATCPAVPVRLPPVLRQFPPIAKHPDAMSIPAPNDVVAAPDTFKYVVVARVVVERVIDKLFMMFCPVKVLLSVCSVDDALVMSERSAKVPPWSGKYISRAPVRFSMRKLTAPESAVFCILR